MWSRVTISPDTNEKTIHLNKCSLYSNDRMIERTGGGKRRGALPSPRTPHLTASPPTPPRGGIKRIEGKGKPFPLGEHSRLKRNVGRADQKRKGKILIGHRPGDSTYFNSVFTFDIHHIKISFELEMVRMETTTFFRFRHGLPIQDTIRNFTKISYFYQFILN